MKKKFILISLLIAYFFIGNAQQIPNGGFEQWTNAYTPVSWGDVEGILGDLLFIDSSLFTFKDTTTYTQGATSVKLVTDTVPGSYSQAIGINPGVVSLGTATLDPNTFNPIFTGIAFIYRPDSIIFDYNLTSPGIDTAAVFINRSKKTVPLLGYPDSGGLTLTLLSDTAWTHKAISLAPYYLNNFYPDTLMIQFLSSNTQNPIVGTTLHVDGVRFGYLNPPLSVTTSGGTTICTGDSVTLSAQVGPSTGYTYQWKLGGTNIAGATSSSYNAGTGGAYTVTIDSAQLTATSQPIVVVDTNCLSGVNDITSAKYAIYPNPATNMLNITSGQNMEGYNLRVFDIVGRQIINQYLAGSNNVINVTNLSNGTYVFQITDKETGVIAQSKFNVVK